MASISCKILVQPEWKPNQNGFTNSELRVHKCFIPDHLTKIDDYWLLLNEEEKIRASKYHHKKDSQRFIIARAKLKLIAANYLNLNAKDIKIGIGTNKKPFISIENQQFLEYNIAHSGDWIVLAFSFDSVGIDIEYMSTTFDFESIVSACFSVNEQAFIHNSDNARNVFYLLWTRKESFVKAISIGLDENLPQIPCLDGVWELSSNVKTTYDWQLISFQLDHDYWVSVVCRTDKKNILFVKQDI